MGKIVQYSDIHCAANVRIPNNQNLNYPNIRTDEIFDFWQIYGHLNQTKLIRTASMYCPSSDSGFYSSVIGHTSEYPTSGDRTEVNCISLYFHQQTPN